MNLSDHSELCLALTASASFACVCVCVSREEPEFLAVHIDNFSRRFQRYVCIYQQPNDARPAGPD